MNKIIYNLVFNRKKNLNSRGTALIQVEAYLSKQKKYFSTNVYLKPDQWDEKKQLVKNHPNAEALNQMLHEYVASIEKEELMIWKKGKSVTLDALKESLKPGKDTTSFIEFCTDEIMNSSLKDSTKKNHLTTLELVKEFRKNISIAELNYDFICAFDNFLQMKGYHLNTIAKHMKHIKRHINIAINKELIDIKQYAFRKYKIKSTDNHHSYLSPQELHTLERANLPKRYMTMKHTLDAFLFCCYTGLRYSDFVSLDQNNFIEMENETWLIYKSVKTKMEIRLPLYLLFEGKSLEILSRYKENINDFFKLKDNSNINKELLKIAKLTGLTKHISFHTARHTNATLLIYNGMNITSVQKILGHKNVKTTQIYSTVMDMTLVRDLKKIYCGNSSNP